MKKLKQDQPAKSSLEPRAAFAGGAATWGVPLPNAWSPRDDLDWKPTLGLVQEACCVAASGIICALLLALTPLRSAALTTRIAAAASVLGLCLLLLRGWLTERMFKAHQRPVFELGDHDSLFPRLDGILVHEKARVAASLRAASGTGGGGGGGGGLRAAPRLTALHCFHGFGANLYSWDHIQQRLAERLGGLVTAHDMPGFGLTERPTKTSQYFLEYNGRVGRMVQDHELHLLGLTSAAAATAAAADAAKASHFQADTQQDTGSGSGGGAAAALECSSLSDSSESARGGTPTASTSGQRSSFDGSSDEAAPAGRAGAAVAAAGWQSSPSRLSSPSVELSSPPESNGGRSSSVGDSSAPGGSVKRVLCGHSLGGICAVLEALRRPQDVSALVLIAPAIMARPAPSQPIFPLQPRLSHPAADAKAATVAAATSRPSPSPASAPPHAAASGSAPPAPMAREFVTGERPTPGAPAQGTSATEFGADPSAAALPLRPGKGRNLGGAAALASSLLQGLALAWLLLALRLCRPLIVQLLRTLVRSKGFWYNGLSRAYFNPALLTADVVDAYRMPQLVRGWEAGMYCFLVARLAHVSDLRSLLAACFRRASTAEPPPEDVDLSQRLAALLAAQPGLKVLVIHGEEDGLVPCSNSRRLARMLPGVELVTYAGCGHMPQEELPAEVSERIAAFVERLP